MFYCGTIIHFVHNKISLSKQSELACHVCYASLHQLLLGDAPEHYFDHVLCLSDALGLDSKEQVQMVLQG